MLATRKRLVGQSSQLIDCRFSTPRWGSPSLDRTRLGLNSACAIYRAMNQQELQAVGLD
jgi:hypothetical protein